MPMPSSRQVGSILSSMPREMTEYSICRSADRMDGCGAADRVGADFGKADVADEACLHHVGDGADCIFDGHRGIEACRAVDVDMVHAEPLERIGECGLHSRGTGIEPDPAGCRIALGLRI
jgi:hypothetical protein